MDKEDKHQCLFCNAIFSVKGSLKRHEDSIHKNIRFDCRDCGKQFKVKGKLTTHRTVLVESNSLKLEFKLFLCNPRFLLDSQLHLLNANTILVDLNLTKTGKTSDVVETNLSYHR